MNSTAALPNGLLLGTRKGIFTMRKAVSSGRGSQSAWTIRPPSFLGHIAQHVVQDPRDPARIVAGVSTVSVAGALRAEPAALNTIASYTPASARPTAGNTSAELVQLGSGVPFQRQRQVSGASPVAAAVRVNVTL